MIHSLLPGLYKVLFKIPPIQSKGEHYLYQEVEYLTLEGWFVIYERENKCISL